MYQFDKHKYPLKATIKECGAIHINPRQIEELRRSWRDGTDAAAIRKSIRELAEIQLELIA